MSQKKKRSQRTGQETESVEPHHRSVPTPSSRIRWRLACLIPALVVFTVHLLSAPRSIHEDEIYWIGSSYYYQLAVVDGDASNTDWQLLPARENPALGKYVLGAALGLTGNPVTTPDLLGSFYLMFANVPGAWGSDEAYEKRLAVAMRVAPPLRDAVRHGRGLPWNESQLSIARNTALLFGMIAAIGIAILGMQCHWKAGGVIAGILFALHPVVADSYSLAMIDIIAIAFSIWFMVGLVAILCFPEKTKSAGNKKNQTSNHGDSRSSPDHSAPAVTVQRTNSFLSRSSLQRIALTLFTAVMLAFACGTKMNSLVVAATAAACGIWCLLQIIKYRIGKKTTVRNNEVPHHDLRGITNANPAELLNARILMLSAVALLAVILFIGTNPTLYGDPIDGVLALSYEHALTADIQEDILGGRLTTVSERIQVLAALVCHGPWAFIGICLAVAWLAYDSARKQTTGIILVLWWAIALLLLMMWLPFGWDRYALPLIPPTVLILGATVENMSSHVWSKISRSKGTAVS